MTRLSLLALAFATANASFLSRRQDDESTLEEDNARDVCTPTAENGAADFNAPCNALASIQYECMYGPIGGELIRTPPQDIDPSIDLDTNVQSNETQRICICQSQFNDMAIGCMKCFHAHGGLEGQDWYSDSAINSAMKSYCAVDTPMTEGFDDFFYTAVEGGSSATESSTGEPTASPSDIGNATDVSLYFTPAVTGRYVQTTNSI